MQFVFRAVDEVGVALNAVPVRPGSERSTLQRSAASTSSMIGRRAVVGSRSRPPTDPAPRPPSPDTCGFVWQRASDPTGTLDIVRELRQADQLGTLRNKLAHYQRPHVLIVDLCRYRDYADIVAAAGLSALRGLGFLAMAPAGLSA